MTNNMQPTLTAPNLAATSMMPQNPFNPASNSLLGAPGDAAQVRTQYNPVAYDNQYTSQSTEPLSLGHKNDLKAVPHERYG